jgi:hypothetical protein
MIVHVLHIAGNFKKNLHLMNKIILSGTTAMAILAMSACSSQDFDDLFSNSADMATIKAVISDSDASRTYVDESGKITWAKGDKFYSLSTKFVYTNDEADNVATATFTSSSSEKETGTYAVYPYFDNNTAPSLSGSELTVNLPESYEYTVTDNSFTANLNEPMLGTFSDNTCSFKHLAGVLRLQFSYLPKGTKSVKFEANVRITGQYTTSLEGTPELKQDDQTTGNAVTVNLSTATTEDIENALINIPLPTGSYAGFTVSALDASDNVLFAITTSKTYTLARTNVATYKIKTSSGKTVTYSSVFPADFSKGLQKGWAAVSNSANAQVQTVDNGLQITCNQTAAKYRTDLKYNMFGDYNANKNIWINFDASKYKVFAIKFIGKRPTSGVLKLSNISVAGTWIKNTDGYSLSEQGYTDIVDNDGNHTYYWTIGGDNWTGNISIDRIEVVIADIASDEDKTFTVSSINWYQSEQDLKNSLNLPVVNETNGSRYTDLTSAWKAASDGDVILVKTNQEVSELLNSSDRSITIKGASKDITITRKSSSNMLFLCNTSGKVITIENLTIDGNNDSSSKNLTEASSSGQIVFNNVTIQNAKSSDAKGLVVAKSSGKVALNGITFSNCTTNNDSVDVFVGANGSTIAGNNTVNISIEVNSSNYSIQASSLTNTTPIKLTPYNGVTAFNAGATLVKGTTDTSKFTLNVTGQSLEADSDNNALVVKATE